MLPGYYVLQTHQKMLYVNTQIPFIQAGQNWISHLVGHEKILKVSLDF